MPCEKVGPDFGGAGFWRSFAAGQRDHDLAGADELLHHGGGLFASRAEGRLHAGSDSNGEGDGAGRDNDIGEAGIARQIPAAGDFDGGKGGLDGGSEFGIGHGCSPNAEDPTLSLSKGEVFCGTASWFDRFTTRSIAGGREPYRID